MAAVPTPDQIKNGAGAVAYRAWQLAGAASVLRRGIQVDSWSAPTIQNALVESALTNARGLAWFFTGHKSDVDTSLFSSQQDDEMVRIARKVVRPISLHLSHVDVGVPEGNELPGPWPVSELAVVFVGAVATFVEALDPNSDTYQIGWFTPSPIETHGDLMALDPLADPTPISDNRSVGKLTRALQQHLEASAWRTK